MVNLASRVSDTRESVVYLSRYDVIQAFFRTEDEENEDMAKQLNIILNCFCAEERSKGKNVSELPFSKEVHKKTIAYIQNALNR